MCEYEVQGMGVYAVETKECAGWNGSAKILTA